MTLNGMFLMTIAVGIISSSAPGTPGDGDSIGGCWMPARGGEPPPEERSVLPGDIDRWSVYGLPAESIHP